MSLSNKDSNIYDELTELSDENSALREALARSEYEVLMLTHTIMVLQKDAVATCINNQLKIKLIEGRVLQ